MRLLVEGEIADAKCGSQGCGLTEAEGKPLAGDGVYRAGGVADESDVAGGDTTQGTVEGDGASGSFAGLSRGETVGERGKVPERLLRVCNLFVVDEGDADFTG